MESLRFVSDLDDRKPASVRLLNSTVVNPYYSASASPVQSELGKSSAVRSELGCGSDGVGQWERVESMGE